LGRRQCASLSFQTFYLILRAYIYIFGHICNLQSIYQNEADTKQDTSYLLGASFLCGFFFDPEDGGDMFLENII
jgi:hypothetical protein